MVFLLKQLVIIGLAASAAFAANNSDYELIAACQASREENLDGVRAALENNADINVKFEANGQTCFMASCLQGNLNVVKHLFELGADTSIPEKDGYTPTHGAAFQGRVEVMQFLADSGFDLNEFHEDGFAPLHRTCWGRRKEHADTFKLLVDLGVDPELPSITQDAKTCREMTKNPWIQHLLGDKNEF